ncbi:hypothetical protein DYI37_16800 [Fulvimarina endophytica]|uniref:Uncharacterized protein n=1 Tax=Fulvimarina endophytica TaxID=2293836 RepID=A0A371WYX4_9HYPH|nr:hypothetical protein [Fulvimarina endophytica]RFC62172.1 hypothetical protein DYI37_16800 [Fulvimarina endophytica]
MDASNPTKSSEKVASSTQIFTFSPGLYSVTVTDNRYLNTQDKVALPALHIVPVDGAEHVDLLGSKTAPWLSRIGEAVVIRVADGDAALAFVSLKPADRPDAAIGINLQRIDADGPKASAPAALSYAGAQPAPGLAGRPDIGASRNGMDRRGPAAQAPGSVMGQNVLRCEVLVHVQRYGDMRVSDLGWAGLQGQGNWIEAVAITPLESIPRASLEYKGLTAGGVETSWIRGGDLCGSRGMGQALTGIAIRLTGEAAQRYDVSYEGSFVSGGRGAKGQNGSPLRSDRIGDALEALRVFIVERRTEADQGRIF